MSKNIPQHDETDAGRGSPKGRSGKSGPGQNSPCNENKLDLDKWRTGVDVLQWLPNEGVPREIGLSRGATLSVWPMSIQFKLLGIIDKKTDRNRSTGSLSSTR